MLSIPRSPVVRRILLCSRKRLLKSSKGQASVLQQSRRFHCSLSSCASKHLFNSRSFSSCISKEDIKLEPADKGAVKELKEALAEGGGKVEEGIVDDYKFLLFSIREKMRLTVEWNETTKMTQRESVIHTAARVGFAVDYKDEEKEPHRTR